VSTWPGADLVSARSTERILRRQRNALCLLAGTAAAGLALADTNRLLVTVALAAAAGTVIVSAARVYERDRGDRSADALIESGFRSEGREDAVSRAVADRVAGLESDRTRRSLAGALRAHIEIDRDAPRRMAAGCPAVPVLRGLGEHSEVVERIASDLERGVCDPRAIIRVERLLTTPPAVMPGDEGRAELDRQLRGIARLLRTGT
jgi:hypothetical protein